MKHNDDNTFVCDCGDEVTHGQVHRCCKTTTKTERKARALDIKRNMLKRQYRRAAKTRDEAAARMERIEALLDALAHEGAMQ